MTNLFLRSAALGAALLAGGCVSLLPKAEPPKPRYSIEAVDASALAGAPLNWSLVVEDPRTTRVYDSVRIAVTTGPGKIEYFAGGEWADRAPRLFQTALIETFEDSGRILAVGDRSAVPVGDIVLQTDIRSLEFNVENGGENAVVSIYARLTDGKGRVFVAKRFDATRAADSNEADDVVAAFNSAAGDVIANLTAWTLEEGQKIVAARS